jgi:WD40 repeat protein/guanylate kinase
MIDFWYVKDDNSITARYILQPRVGKYEDWNEWGDVENSLREVFISVVNHELKDVLNPIQKSKYIKSATEQEIIEGLFENKDVAKRNIYFYNRNFTNIDKMTSLQFKELETKDKEYRKKDSSYQITVKQFSDFKNFNENELDSDIRPNHKKLIYKIKESLPKDNIKEYELDLNYKLDRTQDSVTTEYLEQFAKDFEQTIMHSIKKEIENFQNEDIYNREFEEQNIFLDEKSRIFVGRNDFLKRVDKYIEDKNNNYPFVIYASSGSGKSSLMSKIIKNSKQKYKSYNIIYRFVGISDLSNNPINLFTSIYFELISISEVSLLLNRYFMQTQLSQEAILSSIKELSKVIEFLIENYPSKLIIFLDALDQFIIVDKLNWLPMKLPQNVKIILSTLPNEDKYKNIDYLPRLREKYKNSNNFLFLESFNKEEASSMIEEYLNYFNRTVTTSQKNKLLNAFIQNGSPLYLKILLEEAMEWKSYTIVDNEIYPKDTDELIERLFDRLNSKFHHSKPLINYSCAYIACSKGGLSESEMFDILTNEKDIMDDVSNIFYPRPIRLPTAVWARLYSQISHYMSIKNVNGIDKINFFHRKFNEGAYKLLGTKEQAHKRLALFYDRVYNKELNVQVAIQSVLTQLPYQLIMSKQNKKAFELLTNFEFLMKKFKINGVDEVLEDYELARNIYIEDEKLVERFYIFDNFINSNKDILNSHDKSWDSSKIFFQLSIEHANNSILTKEALKFEVGYSYIADVNRLDSMYLSPLLSILDGNKNGVKSVEILEDGNILSFANDNNIRIWDKKRYECIHIIENDFQIDGIRLLKNRNILAFSKEKIVVIDKNSYEIIYSFEDKEFNIRSLYILNSTDILIYDNTELKILDSNNLNTIKTLQIVQEEGEIKTLKILENGTILVVFEKYCLIFDRNLIQISRLDTIKSRLKNIFMLNSGDWISFYWKSGLVTIWNKDSFEIKKEIELENKLIENINILSDKYILMNFYQNENIEVWEIDTLKKVNTLVGHQKSIKGIDILPNKNIISYSYDNNLLVWDVNTFETIAVLKGHTFDITNIAILKNGNILSYSFDSTLRLWNKDNFECIGVFEGQQFGVSGIKLIDDDKVLSYSYDNAMRVWDLDNIKYAKRQDREQIHNSIVLNNQNILTYDEKNLYIWDKDTLKPIAKFIGHTTKIVGVIVLDDDKILSFSWDKTLRVWNINTQECMAVLSGHTDDIENVKILENGNIVSYSKDKTLKIWDKNNFELLATLQGHTKNIENIIVNSNNIISYSRDNSIRVWNSQTFELIALLQAHQEWIRGVQFLNNGNLISYSQDNTIRIWDKDSYNCLKVLDEHQDYIADVIILGNGDILSSSGDKTVKIWSSDSFECLATLSGHSGAILSINFLDNQNIVTHSSDKSIKIWDNKTYKCMQTFIVDKSILDVKLTNNKILAMLQDRTVNIYSQDNLEYIDIITNEDKENYTYELLAFGNAIKVGNIIYENHFDNNYINIKNIESGEFLKWYSKYKPIIKSKISDKVLISDGGYSRVLNLWNNK